MTQPQYLRRVAIGIMATAADDGQGGVEIILAKPQGNDLGCGIGGGMDPVVIGIGMIADLPRLLAFFLL